MGVGEGRNEEGKGGGGLLGRCQQKLHDQGRNRSDQEAPVASLAPQTWSLGWASKGRCAMSLWGGNGEGCSFWVCLSGRTQVPR